MAYTPSIWVDGQTVITAADMSRIEAALVEQEARIAELAAIVETGGGTAPVTRGDGFVGEIAADSPYSEMRVRAVDDAYEVKSFDIVHTGGGKTRTVRVQGEYVADTPGIDSYQRIEEIWLGDYLACPRSNLEFAFQLTVGGNTQFIPYHGTSTSKSVAARPVQYRDLDGTPLNLAGLQYGQSIVPNGFVIDQSVYGRHPSAGTQNLVRIDTVTTFHPDGLIEVSGSWEALVEVTVGAVYAPMTPYQQADMTRLQHTGGTVALDTAPPSVTTNQDLPDTISSGLLTASSRPGVQVAWAWTDPSETLRMNEPDRKANSPIIFVQRRTDAINKIYPHVWQQGTTVAAGTRWEFGAQWRYQEQR